MPTLSDITAALRKPVHSLRQRILGSQNKRVQLVIETVRQTIRDDVTLMAAGVAYYAVLSLFPLTLLLLAGPSSIDRASVARARSGSRAAALIRSAIGAYPTASGRS